MKFFSMSYQKALVCLLIPLCIYCGYKYAQIETEIKLRAHQTDWNTRGMEHSTNNRNLNNSQNVSKKNGDNKESSTGKNVLNKAPKTKQHGKENNSRTRVNATELVAVTIVSMNNLTLPLFQPLDEMEFPTVQRSVPRIPSIIHQIYNNESVPEIFTRNIRTFVKFNPTWEYKFWTYESGRQLVQKRHQYLIQTYDSFKDSVKKADLLKYVVLYEFGGVYADLDVENLRPLDKTRSKYPCILPTEPFEHSSIFYKDGDYVIIGSAVLLCRPKHPFFKKVLSMLSRIVNLDENPIGVTGPDFLTNVFMKYNEYRRSEIKAGKLKLNDGTNSPYFYRGNRKAETDDGIYIPNTQYFMDDVDKSLVYNENNRDVLHACLEFDKDLPFALQRACAEYEARKGVRRRRRFTFTVHYWKHLWTLSKEDIDSLETRHIRDIVPLVQLYSN